jgi:hypothetical protein
MGRDASREIEHLAQGLSYVLDDLQPDDVVDKSKKNEEANDMSAGARVLVFFSDQPSLSHQEQ